MGWFTPNFGITPWLNVCIALSAVFQLACTLVPEPGGVRTSWHRALAGISALFLIPSLALLLGYSTITTVAKGLVVVSLAVMATCMYLVAKYKCSPQNFLIIQSAFFAAFFLPILYINYLQ